MNRANFGNIVTNGIQTLAVSGFTGANAYKQSQRQKLADASSALNNMTLEEAGQVGKMRADELNEQVRQHNNQTNGMEHLTDEEQKKYGDKKAQGLRDYINGEEESIDDYLEGGIAPQTAQGIQINENTIRKLKYLEERVAYVRDGSRFAKLDEMLDREGGDE